MKKFCLIEPLEDRIAPATIVNPYTVTYQDGGGDTAIVHISKPLFTSAKAAGNILQFVDDSGNSISETFTGNSTAENLSTIDLIGRSAAHDMNISVKVLPEVGVGNLTVNVGYIEAANVSQPYQITHGIDLGSIYIQGNLGGITAGDHYSTPAIHSLTALSMASGGTESLVLGPISKLNVLGNFNTYLDVIGYQFGSIGKLTIAGTLGGDSAGDSNSGEIGFTGHIGSATIGSITGTAGDETGLILGSSANASYINSIHVLGSVTGGSGSNSGEISALAKIGKVTIDGSLVGGQGQDSGLLAAPLGNVKIAGSVTGGNGSTSGAIISETFSSSSVIATSIGNLTIGGSVTGAPSGTAASGSTAAVPGQSGFISATTAKHISIAGSLVAATGLGYTDSITGESVTTTDQDTGAIFVNAFKSLSILGSISGGDGSDSGVVMGNATESLFGSAVIPKVSYANIYVGGTVAGGSASDTGSILANGLFGGTISTLRIGGNLDGGTANDTGEILVTGNLTAATIGGSLIGNTSIDATVVGSAYIQAGYIGSLHIAGSVSAGSLIAGASNSGFAIANCGAIRSAGAIGSIVIGGSVTGVAAVAGTGPSTSIPANPVYISATQGPAKPANQDTAIQTVTIDGNASYLDLLAGYSPTVGTSSTPASTPLGTPTDASAGMGHIIINGSMAASNIVAGVEPDSSGNFGNAGNTIIPTNVKPNVHSTIASLIVAGQATGDGGSSSASNSFGIVAEQLPSVSLDGTDYSAIPGTPDSVAGSNLFVYVIE